MMSHKREIDYERQNIISLSMVSFITHQEIRQIYTTLIDQYAFKLNCFSNSSSFFRLNCL